MDVLPSMIDYTWLYMIIPYYTILYPSTFIIKFYESMWLSIRICMIIDDDVAEKRPVD
jgi:hypothetical protein